MWRIARVMLALVSLALAWLLWLWVSGGEERAIREMPDPERRALFLRTLENLKHVCHNPEGGMQDFCHGEARRVLLFPECDAACEDLARALLEPIRSPR